MPPNFLRSRTASAVTGIVVVAGAVSRHSQAERLHASAAMRSVPSD